MSSDIETFYNFAKANKFPLTPDNTFVINHNLVCNLSRIEKLISYIKENYNGQPNCAIDQMNEGLLKETLQLLPIILSYISKDTEIYLTLGLMPSDKSVQYVKQIFSDFHIQHTINVLFSGYWMSALNNNLEYVPSLNTNVNKPQKFLCYNNAGRPWRVDVSFALKKMGAINDSILSCVTAVDPKFSILYANDDEYAEFNKSIPIYYNMETGRYGQDYNKIVREHYENTYISIVTESRFSTIKRKEYVTNLGAGISGILLSEKTFRTIIAGHPFILMSDPYSLQALKETGFKTFSNVIDESYDEIEDDKQRFNAIIAQIERLHRFTQKQWLDFQHTTRPIRKHNFDNMRNLVLHDDFYHPLTRLVKI